MKSKEQVVNGLSQVVVGMNSFYRLTETGRNHRLLKENRRVIDRYQNCFQHSLDEECREWENFVAAFREQPNWREVEVGQIERPTTLEQAVDLVASGLANVAEVCQKESTCREELFSFNPQLVKSEFSKHNPYRRNGIVGVQVRFRDLREALFEEMRA